MNPDLEWQRRRKEFHGATHVLRESDKTQGNDPAWLMAWGGAPETLGVSQAIEHEPVLSRHQSFLTGTQDASDAWEAWGRTNSLMFNLRRARRYRRAWNGYAGDEPYDVLPDNEDRYRIY
jgi:hypothetical protein